MQETVNCSRSGLLAIKLSPGDEGEEKKTSLNRWASTEQKRLSFLKRFSNEALRLHGISLSTGRDSECKAAGTKVHKYAGTDMQTETDTHKH
jgi:hypothetical protein